jgi:acyl-CoA thioesterase-1
MRLAINMARMIPTTALGVLAALGGCGPARDGGGAGRDGEGAPAAETAAALAPRAGEGPAILVIGTSLTAGYGLDPGDAWPAVLQRRLDSLGLAWRVVNAGVSGETSAGALRRVDEVLTDHVRVVILETGANDGLRGLEPDSTRANLEAIVARIRARDATVAIVLAGMEAPPNLGPRFIERFRAVFPEVAAARGLRLVPFLLEGVAGVDSLNQEDGIHPTRRGHELVARNVWAILESVLADHAPPGGADSTGRHLP